MSDPPEDGSSLSEDSPGTVSMVRLPRRRGAGAPVPWAVRRGGDSGPLCRSTPVGTVDSGELARVDPAGMVSLSGRSWSLDWWIRAEDRWHHPSMEPAVSQQAVDGTPVLRTEVRVPGGRISATSAAARVDAGGWSDAATVIEVHNESAVPVALALMVRPYRLDGPGGLERVEILPGASGADATAGRQGEGGVALRVEGSEPSTVDTLLFDRMPARIAHGSTREVLAALSSGSDDPVDEPSVAASGLRLEAPDGDPLEVALVFPLAHVATLRVAVLPCATQQRRGAFRFGGGTAAPSLPARVPELSSVVAGWNLHGAEDPQLSWVVDQASDLLTWSGTMLRVVAPGFTTRCLDPSTAESAQAARSLTVLARSVASLPGTEMQDAMATALARCQRFSGRVEPVRGQDATVALLWTAAALVRDVSAAHRAEHLVGPIAKAIHHLDRAIAAGKGPDETTTSEVADDQCTAAALRQVAVGLVALGQPDVAERALDVAARSDAILEAARTREPARVSLLAPVVAEDPAVALVEDLAAGLPGAHDANTATTTGGFSTEALARLRNRLVDAVIRDEAIGPAALPLWRSEWNGRDVEVHRMPTAWGLAAVALRWHEAGPALLWDITPWIGDTSSAAVPVISAPGIAPGWRATGWEGEALLDVHG